MVTARTKLLHACVMWALAAVCVADVGQGAQSAQPNGTVAQNARQDVAAPDQGGVNEDYARGLAFLSGDGVPQSYEQAVIWLRKAAEQGLPDAQNFLAVMYDNGTGLPMD